MATQRALIDYPGEYFTLFMRGCKEEVSIPCDNIASAKRLRGRLYAFREALYLEPFVSPRHTLICALIRFTIKDSILTVQPYEEVQF